MKEYILCIWKRIKKKKEGEIRRGEKHIWLHLAKFTTIFKMVLQAGLIILF